MSVLNIDKGMLKDRLYHLIRIGYDRFFSLLFYFAPLKKNKIVFNSNYGKGYGDNGKYIVEALLKQDQDYDIVWMLDRYNMDHAVMPDKVRRVRYGSIQFIYEMMTAKVWVDNSRLKYHLYKRKSQFYIQTWHGGLGLKKVEADTELCSKYVKMAKRDSRLANLFISNSGHLSHIFKNAFWYNGDILECGSPKNDILFADKTPFKEKVRAEFQLPATSKILLYAPTFRDNNNFTAYDIDLLQVKAALEHKYDENWVMLVRLHPNIDSESVAEIFPDKQIINASRFPDMQELILGSDMLVTDYSSCMFDSGMAEIPTFIYASDVESYVDERGFYFTMQQQPFDFATDTQGLINALYAFNQPQYLANLAVFYDKVKLYDKGQASTVVAGKIKKVIKGQQISITANSRLAASQETNR
ncbi:CDP-glycerol glycerophosphotransferase family protein [Oceanisphaera avium]|uniref:Glycerophosphotransferase n=1 Tax=Oceanisphaera avium TaxID=1903694 RepID=A0A1Y0CTY6_9GAMM|nr:CDP-glycerol glycerophosphotransferase family protein [Oceanisphaera avium]ART78810.1 hypothetical protein CBP12_00445 [Oceanisphaera avium]